MKKNWRHTRYLDLLKQLLHSHIATAHSVKYSLCMNWTQFLRVLCIIILARIWEDTKDTHHTEYSACHGQQFPNHERFNIDVGSNISRLYIKSTNSSKPLLFCCRCADLATNQINDKRFQLILNYKTRKHTHTDTQKHTHTDIKKRIN